MGRRSLTLAIATTALALAVPTARAGVLVPSAEMAGPGNGAAIGADGNLWVALASADAVQRIGPGGQLVGGPIAVGDGPTTVAAGPGGHIWVAVTGAQQLARLDTADPAAAPQLVPTGALSACGPVGLVDGGDGNMYFSLPSDGMGACASYVGRVPADMSAPASAVGGVGRAFDLVVAGGKLFVPDWDGDAVRRLSIPGLAVEATVTTLGTPNGITVGSDGRIWTTLWTRGAAAYFPAAQNGGTATEVPGPVGGELDKPFGIAPGPGGHIHMTGGEHLGRIEADATWTLFHAGAGTMPWTVATGSQGDDLWITDLLEPRVRHFVDGAPRIASAAASHTAATESTIGTFVDPRGNATQVVLEYGTTTAYGSTSAPVEIPAGVGAAEAALPLTGLQPGTTYVGRVRATNALGTATHDVTFATSPATTPPAVAATVSVKARVKGRRTKIRRLRVKGLTGAETVTVRCRTRKRGCRFRTRTYTSRTGTLRLERRFKKRLRPKARITVSITRPGHTGRVARITIRRGKKPRLVLSTSAAARASARPRS